jgi:hypothetical protein
VNGDDGRISLRTIVAAVGAIVFASFIFASVSLAVSLTERDARINENTRQTHVNSRRQMRNCERIGVIVAVLDKETPSVALTAELAAIDRKYPDVSPCPPAKEKKP